MKALIAAVLLIPSLVLAQAMERGMFTTTPRSGVTQSSFIAGMGEVKPQAVVIVYNGGYGNINLRMQGGQPKFNQGSFGVRNRADFIRNGIQPVLVDVPSDESRGASDAYRMSDKQVTDTRAVLAEIRKRAPALPVFIMTTSRSTLSGANLAAALAPDEVAGVVLSSSISVQAGPGSYSLGTFNFKNVKVPLLIVHHRGDTCRFTPYRTMAGIGQGFTLISVNGGKPPESDPCEPQAAHGFYGKESETTDAIAGWMLKKPFKTEIE
ncbi:MAG TPA: hypothetical protein VNH80_08045 [Burkholderiales bacterium]|jgi:hypothetical protein|nr:hypothetical protein [Burkholderiales bacterium]